MSNRSVASSNIPRVWRLYNIAVNLDEDPGKDHHQLHPSLLKALSSSLRYNFTEIEIAENRTQITIVRKSFDSRTRLKQPQFVYTVDVSAAADAKVFSRVYPQDGAFELMNSDTLEYGHQQSKHPTSVSTTPISSSAKVSRQVIVVGAGPAGLFAALQFVRAGLQPIVIERGKPVEQRGQSIGALFNRKILDPESNLCYGEGGAGTWSDGKLTTRIGKNSRVVRSVLEDLVQFGAPARILVDGKPHLGTDRLVRILKNMREYLVSAGAVFRFNCTVDQLIVDRDSTGASTTSSSLSASDTSRVSGVVLTSGEVIKGDAVLLSVGHSARKLYAHLQSLGVHLEAKPIAAGFRIEHPQELINRIQYGNLSGLCEQGTGPVPVADYRLAVEVEAPSSNEDPYGTRGCYSFCMCPGGQIVPTSVQEDELCINGMSFSKRQSRWANSAVVVTVHPNDMKQSLPALLADEPDKHGLPTTISPEDPLLGVYWQRLIERRASRLGGGNLVVPVQRATDFLSGHTPGSTSSPDDHLDSKASSRSPISSSYRLGVKETSCHTLYPEFITHALRQALELFDRRMPGFLCDEAILHGVETRTSAPVQIVRDRDSCESISLRGLYPAGEGAGYAGGIVSAAVDGMRVAEAIVNAVGSEDRSHRSMTSAQPDRKLTLNGFY